MSFSSTGEPDFDTPDNIKQAAIKAIEPARQYTPVPHPAVARSDRPKIQSARTAATTSFADDRRTRQAYLFNALLATLNPGDEVIIPAPYWVSTPIFRSRVAPPVAVEAKMEHGFKLQASARQGYHAEDQMVI